MKLILWISAAALALGAGGYGALADAGHSHNEQYKMLQDMQDKHSGHDHAHNFGAMEDVSPEDMHRTMDLLTDLGLALPPMNSERGREVFLERGCIVCHSVNGVGGEIGPSLNAADMPEPMNAFEFAARMWRGAPVMAEMQRDLLGTMIDLNGQDLADIIAFTHDEAEQKELSITQVPEQYRDLIAQ
ncbi:cytochrome c [Pelagibius sp. CAU 1746]|uniref:cytochrome c n=1 Tax=Pelagibius sp. CAU 1746 TaxID=3140370 RepID=UPI00325A6812